MFWLYSKGLINTEDIDALHNPRAVVMRTFANIPGIEMPSEDDNFLRMFTAPDLADHVGAHGFRKVDAIHHHVQFQ